MFDIPDFTPGLLEQDLITIPLEIAADALINNYFLPRSRPLPPFDSEKWQNNESNNKSIRPSKIPRLQGALIGGALVGGSFSYFSLTSEAFPIWTHVRGLTHAVLLTELTTAFAKTTFQRHRPFYENERRNKESTTYDSHFSFFSGHASQAFAIAGYTSALFFAYSNSKLLNFTYAIFAGAGASYVASTRYFGHQHHLTDIVVGGIMGTLVSLWTFTKVERVIALEKTKENSIHGSMKTKFYLFPKMDYSENKRSYALAMKIVF